MNARRIVTGLGLTLAAYVGMTLAPTPAHASGCDVSGVVTDADGHKVAGMEVVLGEGEQVRRTATDREGRYRFVGAGAGPLVVSLVMADGAHEPARFHLYHERRGIVISSDEFSAGGSCERDFDFAAIDERYPEGDFPKKWWADAVTLYRGFAQALSLVNRLEVDLGRSPLEIQAFYPAASPDSTFWVGTPSYAPDSNRKPFIGLGVHASTREDGGWPGNREDHEIGHHVLARAFGGVIPRARADTGHGGYWVNPTSSDAWVEGFASFYAVMVAKHVRASPRPSWLAVEGGVLDVELDYRPWDLGGLEEVAVAGLLLDLEDGPSDYAFNPGLPTVTFGEVTRHEGEAGTLLSVPVTDEDGKAVADGTVIDLDLLDDAGEPVATSRSAIAHGRAVVVAPSGASSLRLAEGDPEDDDPIDLELTEVWRAIADFTSSKPESNRRLFDVDDLHAAMKRNFGGRDADGDGTDDIEQVFIAHGLFADDNGNRKHDAGEAVGPTSHPASTVVVDGKDVARQQLSPRPRLPIPASMQASMSLSDPRATIVVVTQGASGSPVAYTPRPDAHGRVTLIPPPTGDEDAVSSLTVLALASDKQPAIALQLDAATALSGIEEHSESYLQLTVDLDALASTDSASSDDLRLAWGVFVGGAVTLVFGLALFVVGLVRGR